MPEYQFVSTNNQNHTFKVSPKQNRFEYLLSSAWSEGAVYNNKEDFTEYIRKTEKEFNNQLQVNYVGSNELE